MFPGLSRIQAWESATSFAEAYRLGALESRAALHLMNSVPEPVVCELHRLVRTDYRLLLTSVEFYQGGVVARASWPTSVPGHSRW